MDQLDKSDSAPEGIPMKMPHEHRLQSERMFKWFAYEHLPTNLQSVSKMFRDLASGLVADLDPSPERTVALRKLLEAKDAAVRAAIDDEHRVS